MFQDNHHLKASQCGDWVDFCRDVTMNKYKGVCSAVSCLCDSQKYEGISGDSCELHCLIASTALLVVKNLCRSVLYWNMIRRFTIRESSTKMETG